MLIRIIFFEVCTSTNLGQMPITLYFFRSLYLEVFGGAHHKFNVIFFITPFSGVHFQRWSDADNAFFYICT